MAADMMLTGLSGLNSFSTALSVVSDNIANANTTGYKSNTVDFGDLVSGFIPTEDINTTAQGSGSTVLGVNSDFGNGSEIQTGNQWDLMIQGNGFFEVQDANGNNYFTRDGSFQLYGTDPAKMNLTDMHGNNVLDSAGKAITIDTTKCSSFSIDKFGTITGHDSSGAPTTLGTVGVTTFPNPEGLIRDGENMYTPGSSAGTAATGAPGATGAGTLVSGALEGSNVDLTAQMVNLITFQADYQANSKTVETGNTALQTATNLIH